MSKADDIFWRQFGIILVILTLFGFVVAFIARDIAGDAHQASMNSPMAVAERIAPMGEARVGDPTQVVAAAPAAPAAAPAMAAADSGPIDAEQIYNTACMACHAAGVAGAPKKGDDAAWAPRIAQGEDAMVKSVLNGKGAMPPKAGNPSLNEAQIRAAVQYLTGTAAATPMAAAKDAAAAVSETAQKVVEQAKDMATESAAAVGQAAGAVGSTVSDAASAATSAVSGAVSGAASSVAAVTSASAPAASSGKPGDEVYNAACVACHATGAANAPKLNDKAAWEPRVATGFAALVNSVTKGKGAMPPRGGLTTLSDADIKNAVRYMLKEAGVEAGS